MRIDKIELCNLASLEGEHVIDFGKEPLHSAGIFAITGNTGAGKSTILDAICLALYNRAPRFDNGERMKNLGLTTEEDKKDLSSSDVRNILRRGQTSGYSRVTFSLTDGTTFQATWSVRVKKTGTFDTVQRTLQKVYPKREDYEPREINERITNLTHLTYEQFTRTIILAQNSFANFLHAKQADKSILLENLTGTEMYGKISKIIYEEATNAQKLYDEKLKVIEGINLSKLSDDDLTKLHENLTLYRSQLTRDKNVLKRIEQQLHWYEEFEQAQQELASRKNIQFEAQRDYNSLYNKQQQLERYDSLLPFQELYLTIKQTEQNIARFKEEATCCLKKLTEQKSVLAQNAQKDKAAQDKREERQNAYDQQLPEFNSGHKIQGKISATQTEIKKMNERIAQNYDAMQTSEQELRALQTQNMQNKQRMESIGQRLIAISMHSPLIEHMESVKVQLEKANELKEDSLKLQRSLAEHRKESLGLKEQEQKQNEIRNKLQSNQQSFKEGLAIHDQANHGINSADLQQRLSRLADLHRRSQSALNLWKRITKAYAEIGEQDAKIRRHEISLTNISRESEGLQTKLAALIEARDVLRASYMLSQGENIKELRKQLREGNACPICGATHHPYHTETEQELGHLLTELETNYQEAEANVKNTRKALEEKKEQKADEQGQLQVVRDFLRRIKSELEADVLEWKNYQDIDESFADCSASVNQTMRQSILMQMLDNTEREMKKQQTLNDQFNQHQNAINTLNQQIRTNTEAQQECYRTLSNIQTEQRVLEATIAQEQQKLEKDKHDQTLIVNTLDKFITIPLWKEKWLKDHQSFMQELTNLDEEWTKCTQAQEETGSLDFKLQQQIQSLEKNISEKKFQCSDWEQDVSTLKQDILAKEQQLRRMFGDLTPEQALQKQQNDLRAARQEAEETRKLYDKTREALQIIEGQYQNIIQQQRLQESERQKLRSDLDIRISRFNTDHSTLQYFELEKIFSDPRDWNQLRATINKSRDQLREAEFNLQAASARIIQLQQASEHPSESMDETPQALQDQQLNYNRQLEEVSKQLSHAEALLRMHQSAVEQIESHEPERLRLQEEAERWNQLNRIIGSADGKRFREIAQCYTFKVLTGYANHHLANLTARYRLQARPGTLWLEIIDLDMLSQVRGVNSLSGGETFIVSLALALGLSSLSSNDADIASLFIDEGFGNLDSASLDMVISTLEGLQASQGRKVGIISHTEQIRSRITPQIRLIKSAGGKSRIEIK